MASGREQAEKERKKSIAAGQKMSAVYTNDEMNATGIDKLEYEKHNLNNTIKHGERDLESPLFAGSKVIEDKIQVARDRLVVVEEEINKLTNSKK